MKRLQRRGPDEKDTIGMKWTWKCHNKGAVKNWRGRKWEVQGLLEWTGGKDGREQFPGEVPWVDENQPGGPVVNQGYRVTGRYREGGELQAIRGIEEISRNAHLTQGAEEHQAALWNPSGKESAATGESINLTGDGLVFESQGYRWNERGSWV